MDDEALVFYCLSFLVCIGLSGYTLYTYAPLIIEESMINLRVYANLIIAYMSFLILYIVLITCLRDLGRILILDKGMPLITFLINLGYSIPGLLMLGGLENIPAFDLMIMSIVLIFLWYIIIALIIRRII